MKSILLPGEKKQLLTGSAGPLEMLRYEVPTPRALAIICHPHPLQGGTLHNKVVTTLHKAFAEKGFNTVRFNFRGVGESKGLFDEGRGETEDLFTVLEWGSLLYPTLALYLAGFSFGSFIAYRAASDARYQDKIIQLISIAPPVQYPEFHTLPVPPCPWLVVQGEQDDIVEAKDVYAWLETIGKKIEIVRFADSGHFFHGKLTELKEAIQNNLVLP
jgi:alpha/beta superfamily hydrolase